MQLLQETQVQADEIDALGHLNVRHYLARMDTGIRRLFGAFGLEGDAASAFVRRVDTYSRFRREQFEGATLHTLGGVLDLQENGLRAYVEIRNPERDEVAACFVAVAQLVDHASGQPRAIPAAALDVVNAQRVEIPRHGAPRTLTLEPLRTDVTVELLDELIPDGSSGMMTGKYEADVIDADVDGNGRLREEIDVMFLPMYRAMQTGAEMPGPPVFETSDGRRVGWAMMETRTVRYEQPRLGDHVRYFGADLTVSDKSRHSRRWALNATTGALLGISDSVGVCIDLNARRAIEVPEELRGDMSRHHLPQLA